MPCRVLGTMTTSTTLTALRVGDYLVARIHATNQGPEKPVDIRFLLDTSDSMAGERLTAVKRTLTAARELFRPGDRLTMVGFGNEATLYADRAEATPEGLEQFYTTVESIETDGCTNLSAGLEKLASLSEQGSDAFVLLTDGQINRGVLGTVGLRAMALGVAREAPIHTLGYGADHNRVLLRDIATKTHGSYTYVSNEELLPIAMGDLVAGLRSEVLRGASLRVSPGWTCLEIAGPVIGSVVPDRDYWIVFKQEGDLTEPVRVELVSTSGPEAVAGSVLIGTELAALEQILRVRVARLLAEASDAIEEGTSGTILAALEAMNTELAGLDEVLRSRPLVLRMMGQVAETLETVRVAATRPLPPPPDLLARMSSGAALLSTQRGGYSQADDDPSAHETLFSSPGQRTASVQTRSRYTMTPSAGPQ